MAATAAPEKQHVEIKLNEGGTIRFWPKSAAVMGVRWDCGEKFGVSAKKLLSALDDAEALRGYQIKGGTLSLAERGVFVPIKNEENPFSSGTEHFSDYSGSLLLLRLKGANATFEADYERYTFPTSKLRKAIEEAMGLKKAKGGMPESIFG